MGSRRVGITRRDLLRSAAASLAVGLPARPVRPADGGEPDMVIASGDSDEATRESLEVVDAVRPLQSARQWPGGRALARRPSSGVEEDRSPHIPELQEELMKSPRLVSPGTTDLRPTDPPEAQD